MNQMISSLFPFLAYPCKKDKYNFSNDAEYRKYLRWYHRNCTTVFNRRVFLANILWVIVNVILTKCGIMANSFGNMLNVTAFILTVGSIVQHDFKIGRWLWKLECGAVFGSIAIWISTLM